MNIVESQKNSVNNKLSRMIKYYKKYKDLKIYIEPKEEEFNVEEPEEEEEEEEEYKDIEKPEEEEEYENIEESDEEFNEKVK